MDIKNIFENAIKEYKQASNSIYSIEKSWNLCYGSFVELLENDCVADKHKTIAIELSAYLASYGMYRNSFLLNVNYLALEKIVFISMKEDYRELACFDSEEQIDTICKLKDAIFNKLNEIKTQENIGRNVTDTLISKIMLGTYGCVVAYDQRVTDSLNALCHENILKHNSFCKESVSEWLKFYNNYEIDSYFEGENLTLKRKIDIILWFAKWR